MLCAVIVTELKLQIQSLGKYVNWRALVSAQTTVNQFSVPNQDTLLLGQGQHHVLTQLVFPKCNINSIVRQSSIGVPLYLKWTPWGSKEKVPCWCFYWCGTFNCDNKTCRLEMFSYNKQLMLWKRALFFKLNNEMWYLHSPNSDWKFKL